MLLIGIIFVALTAGALLFGALAVGLLLVIALPVVLAGAIVGTVLFLVAQLLFLPFRLLGWTLAMGVGGALLIAKFLLLFVLGLAGMALLLALAVPLLPLLLVALGVWLLVRSRRPRRSLTV
jgi:hypothetical protein